MHYYIVPLNDDEGLKELRVSTKIYTFWWNGPESGVIYKRKPIEDTAFSSTEEAYNAIRKVAPEYLP